MWLKLRKTTSRGRAAMPSTCWRMRRCRRFRRAFRSSRFSIAALLALHLAGAGGGPSRLARFELGPFAGVAGGLALVGLGWPPRSYARRPLANQFAVDAGHDDAAGGRHLEGDPLGRGNLHRMRVADGERQVAPLLGGTVAHALDLQLDSVPVGDAAPPRAPAPSRPSPPPGFQPLGGWAQAPPLSATSPAPSPPPAGLTKHRRS